MYFFKRTPFKGENNEEIIAGMGAATQCFVDGRRNYIAWENFGPLSAFCDDGKVYYVWRWTGKTTTNTKNRLSTKLFTYKEPNKQFDYEPHITQQLHVEKRWVGVRCLQVVKQSTSGLWTKAFLLEPKRNWDDEKKVVKNIGEGSFQWGKLLVLYRE